MENASTFQSKCLAILVIGALWGWSINSVAQQNQTTCEVPPIQFDSSKLTVDNQIRVSAKNAKIIEEKEAIFSGSVEIQSSTAEIKANNAVVKDNGRAVTASGNVLYQDPTLKVNSSKVMVDSIKKELQMDESRYQLTGFVGRGEAEQISVGENSGVLLSDVTFTTCPVGGEDWQLKASSISFKKGATMGEARNTRFYVGDIPIFYLPYFAFPVSTERQSGLLFPKVTSSSSTGVDIEQPIYWNAAPNFDVTFAPRLMTNRGLQLKTELRYLTRHSYSQFNVEYLAEDTDAANSPARYFYRISHQGALSDNWYISADINRMSDENYIVDLGSDFYNRADTHMQRTLGLNYYGDKLDASLYLRDFDIIGNELSTYRALPELKLQYETPLINKLVLQIESEAAYFDNVNQTAPKATRVHFAPSLTLPLRHYWGELTAQATWFSTYYKQSNLIAESNLDDKVYRNVGQARLFGALFFERNSSWLGADSSMTFEPKFQYLYTSYDNQDNIGFYDSTALLIDADGLFRGREFTGLDRISDNNQVTFGATSRVVDKNNREQFVFSVGQTFYFDESRVATFRNQDNRSAVAAELDWRFTDNWFLHADMQVASKTEKVDRSSLVLEHRQSAQKLVQLNHRYVRDLSGVEINQIGISASWPIAKNWQWVGRIYRDLVRERGVESYTGVEYESCCWSLRVVAQRYLTNRFDNAELQSTDEYDSSIVLQFAFKGIGTASAKNNLLKNGMFGYRQPYGLN